MAPLDPRDREFPHLHTDLLSSALLPLRTATAEAMSALPFCALGSNDQDCRADTGLPGPGAP